MRKILHLDSNKYYNDPDYLLVSRRIREEFELQIDEEVFVIDGFDQWIGTVKMDSLSDGNEVWYVWIDESTWEDLSFPTIKKFEKMTPNDAEEHLKWFLDHRSGYLSLLENTFKVFDRETKLDFSPQSLVPIWEWFMRTKKEVEIFHSELLDDYAPNVTKEDRKEITNTFDWIRELVDAPTVCKMTEGLLDIMMLVSVYFGEVCIKNLPDLRWDFSTSKVFDDRHKPILFGKKNYYINPFKHIYLFSNRKESTIDSVFLFRFYRNVIKPEYQYVALQSEDPLQECVFCGEQAIKMNVLKGKNICPACHHEITFRKNQFDPFAESR